MSQVFNKLRSLKRRMFDAPPELPFPDTLNIESSYACNLKCFMCPRHFDGVPQGMFTLDMFDQWIQPYIHRFKYVHLTGWGEPLMNKDLPAIIDRCRKAGVWTCFTSNGLLLRGKLAKEILETDLELVNVSCDADNGPDYEKVRGKGTFDHLMKTMTDFNSLRREMGAQTNVQWTFIMMRFNYHQLPGAIRLAHQCGYDQIHAKHLETAINRADLKDAMWNTGMVEDIPAEVLEDHDRVLEESKRVADQLGIRLIIHPRRMAFEHQCLVKPITNVFIDYMGRVSSCCYQNPNDVRPYNTPEEKPLDNGVYGDLRLGDLMEMLEGGKYREFQRAWQRGDVPESCRNCLQVNRMTTDSSDKVWSLPEFWGDPHLAQKPEAAAK